MAWSGIKDPNKPRYGANGQELPNVADSAASIEWQNRARDQYNQMQPDSIKMWGDLQDALWKRQRGESPSAANLGMRMGLDQAAQAGAAQAQGASPLLAARQGAIAGGDIGVDVAGQAAAARSQEQAQNMALMQANQRHKDQLQANYMRAGLSAAEAERQARLTIAQQELTAAQLRNKKRQSNINLGKKIAGTGAKIIGAAAGMSDKASKTGISKTSGKDYDEFLDALRGYDFNYKKSHKPEDRARYSGVMAQDLEKSKLGKTAVFERSIPVRGKHKKVKHIDIGALANALTGAAKHLSVKVGG